MLRINELQGSGVVLSGDALLDPVYLAQIACLLKAFGATAAINKVDYLYLQALHGGNIPDEDGVAGIDADVKFQDEIVEENNLLLKDALSPTTIIASEKGSLSLTYALVQCGIFEFYRFDNNYIDGICFLQTGDPDRPDTTPVHKQRPSFYGEGSLVGDVHFNTTESKQWESTLAGLPVDYTVNLRDSHFSVTQIWTRVAAVGRCARNKEPLLTYSPWTANWLMGHGLGAGSREPIKEACPLLKHVVTSQASFLPVEAFIDSLENLIAQAIIREAVEEAKKMDNQLRRARQEDTLLLTLNLIVGTVPIFGQAVTMCSYLYQRIRSQLK